AVAAAGTFLLVDVLASLGLVARVCGAGIAIVAVQLVSCAADAGETDLGAVAHVVVGARRAVLRPRAGGADALLAGLHHVAGEAVATRGTFGRHRTGHAGARLTGVDAVARIRITALRAVGRNRSRGADALLAPLGAVARVAVAASCAIRTDDTGHAGAVRTGVGVGAGGGEVAAGGVPALHWPAWHVSKPLQVLPSLHGVPFCAGVCLQPVTGSHVSTVQGFVSAHGSGVPSWQMPPWQTSAPLHTSLSLHEVPLGAGVAAGGTPARHDPMSVP